MEPAAAVTIIAAILIILALVVYLLAVILELRKITTGLDAVIVAVGEIVSKSEPVNGVVVAINKDLSAGTELLEGLLDKKAGQDDAAGLVESLYPGSGASVLERQGRSGEVKNIDEG
jgi:Flp pilus assembly protein CpaB